MEVRELGTLGLALRRFLLPSTQAIGMTFSSSGCPITVSPPFDDVCFPYPKCVHGLVGYA